MQFDSRRHARVTVVHLDRGSYEVIFAGSHTTGNINGGLGNIQVTPVGAAPRTCAADIIPTRVAAVFVTCYSAAGFADTAFTIQWVVN